jgi:hypothetical protein
MKAVGWIADPSLVSLQADLRTNNEIEKEEKKERQFLERTSKMFANGSIGKDESGMTLTVLGCGTFYSIQVEKVTPTLPLPCEQK